MVPQAGFDSQRGAYELLPGGARPGDTDDALVLWAAELWMWWKDGGASFELGRARLASAGPGVVAGHLGELQEMEALAAPELLTESGQGRCTARHWRSRRLARLARAGTLNEREQAEEVERRRWVGRILGFLQEADLPVCKLATRALDPDAALSSIGGRRRSRTLRARTWTRVRVSRGCVRGVVFPAHVGHVLDYLQDSVQDRCGRSAPGGVAAALGFLEKTGGVTQAVRLSENVVSDRPAYRRAVAWVKLLKNWMSLGFDNVRGLDPRRLVLGKNGLRGFLVRTKTTGPGKKVLEMPVCVHALASLTGHPRLQVGSELWSRPEFAFARDYLLPAPTKGWRSPAGRMINYTEGAGLGRMLLLDPPRSVSCPEGGREEAPRGGAKPIAPPGHLCGSERCERHFAPSVAAVLGVSRDHRDHLGRWGIDARRSDDYVLASRQVVLQVQEAILLGPGEGPSHFDEEDNLRDYGEFVKERVKDCCLEEWLDPAFVFAGPRGGCSLGQPRPSTAEGLPTEKAPAPRVEAPEPLRLARQEEAEAENEACPSGSRWPRGAASPACTGRTAATSGGPTAGSGIGLLRSRRAWRTRLASSAGQKAAQQTRRLAARPPPTRRSQIRARWHRPPRRTSTTTTVNPERPQRGSRPAVAGVYLLFGATAPPLSPPFRPPSPSALGCVGPAREAVRGRAVQPRAPNFEGLMGKGGMGGGCAFREIAVTESPCMKPPV
jgi:hypothetical protein